MLKAHARYALENARRITEGLIDAFKTDDDWFYQSHPKANHAMWIIGHLGLADNMFASRFRPDVASKPDGWDEVFWFGSELKSDRSAYPARDDVLAYFRQRREALMEVLEQLTDEELQEPAPPAGERSPIAGAPCIGHLLLFAAYHEGIHSGQLTIAHRGLGNPPMFG